MIYLCTGTPNFNQCGEQTILTIPSGEGGLVQIALNRNQLCLLMNNSRSAMLDAFSHPQPEVSGPILMHFERGS